MVAGVRIDSGKLSPIWNASEVPQHQWRELIELRRDFLDRTLNYDCRCLLVFVSEAKLMWGPLGYESLDDMIDRAFGLDPVEIDLAVRWLEVNEIPLPIGYEEVKERTAKEKQEEEARRLAADMNVTPLETEQQRNERLAAQAASAGEAGGRGRAKDDSQGDMIPLAIPTRPDRGTSAEYLVRRLKRDAPEIAEALARGEYPSARAAGIAAGIVKVPTALAQAKRLIERMTAAEREELARWLAEGTDVA